MAKLSIKEVQRELRNQKRRRGGTRRAQMETILDLAWCIAWDDCFKQETVEYIVQAEMKWQRRINEASAGLKAAMIKQGIEPGNL
jgi:hypothetical protein